MSINSFIDNCQWLMMNVIQDFYIQLSTTHEDIIYTVSCIFVNGIWKKFFMTFAYNCQWLTKTLFAQFLMYLSMIDDKHSLILLQMIVNHDWWNDLCNVFGHDCQWFMMSICKQFHMHLSMIDEECVYTVSSAFVKVTEMITLWFLQIVVNNSWRYHLHNFWCICQWLMMSVYKHFWTWFLITCGELLQIILNMIINDPRWVFVNSFMDICQWQMKKEVLYDFYR